ncbi:uncharacterized protein LOC101240281 isoform X1 [Hydra vulgaris]|uniref:uncharacterized protein LOC101240281 isoform X1 n=2 Tax=Hydra vulgaris TaxID=6087 RepID=UPI001F5ECE7F|nr:uncharacterized protein LOC101240281 isoform X1 [Hydra vulgaris]XP_047139445.1 uncharacterized protein LOC101240281 isoform X1 [Hydra vulgaris]
MTTEDDFGCISVEKIPEEVFKTLSNNLPYDWKKFCRHLSVRDESIDQVIEEFSFVKEQTYQLINIWRKENPSKTWQDIKAALLCCKRIDLIKECQRKIISRHSKFGVQLPVNTFFSREKELLLIHQHLFEMETPRKGVVLYGMSGVGKSQITKKYCLQFDKFYDYMLWIDAAFCKIKNSMISLAEQLGLKIEESDEETFSIDVVIKKIHNYFRGEKTLYIFDNVDDESIKGFEKYISNELNSFTLINSQWTNWSSNFQQIPIIPFSKDDAFLFMKNRIQSNDDENLKEIVKELRYHPLSINQATVYIIKNRISAEKYLDLFWLYPVEVLENSLQTEVEHKSAIQSISMILYKLERFHETSLKLLTCLSHCDGKKIANTFIKRVSEQLKINEEYQINDAISLLVSYSLLDWYDNISDNLTMHDITQITCKYYQEKKKITETYKGCIISCFKQQLKDANDCVGYGKDFIQHFLFMFRTSKQQMCKEFCQTTKSIRRFLCTKCLFQDAINILNDIQEYNKRTFGEHNLLTLSAKHIYANCLSTLGNYNEALQIYYQVYKLKTETLITNHPSLLSTKENIAICLTKLGKYDEALEIYYYVEKLRIETLGVNHGLTLQTQHNIGTCLNEIGKYDIALEILKHVDDIQNKTLGISHPRTLITKHSVGMCLHKMGKYKEALEIYNDVEKNQTNSLGEKHTSLLDTKHNISLCLYKLANYQEALEIFYQVEKKKKDILPINHPSLLGTKYSIARCLLRMEKYSEALEVLYCVENAYSESEPLKINHPSLFVIKHNIALCMYKLKRYTEAVEIYFYVEKIQTNTLGIDDSRLLDTKYKIAHCLQMTGKYDEALRRYFQIKEQKTKSLQTDSQLKWLIEHNIATCYKEVGRFAKL